MGIGFEYLSSTYYYSSYVSKLFGVTGGGS